MKEQLKNITILLGLMPTDPRYGLVNSVPVSTTSDTRVCFDPENNEIVVFMEHAANRYHGIVRYFDILEPDIKKTLLDNFKIPMNIGSDIYVSSAEDNTDLLDSFIGIQEAIKHKDYEYITYMMPSIGRDGLYLDDVKNIIRLCSQHSEPWVQKSAYICLYNFLVRYVNFEFDDFFITTIQAGIRNHNTEVKLIIDRIKLFCKNFNSSLYESIF